MAFETEDDLISELRNWFDSLDVDFFRVTQTASVAFSVAEAYATGIRLMTHGWGMRIGFLSAGFGRR
ncbi:hypothetical protein PoB_000390500 [Plakobranchus ocellatus]|uniref:Uncharacterized protein n=1 Tax=Plakobranchus ocellatus TaxID=259542 RepID=A0AAV3Y3I9_9GAST|nr:hypothetical protein PoB_000390500 [Plakobranchus ocellatus]